MWATTLIVRIIRTTTLPRHPSPMSPLPPAAYNGGNGYTVTKASYLRASSDSASFAPSHDCGARYTSCATEVLDKIGREFVDRTTTGTRLTQVQGSYHCQKDTPYMPDPFVLVPYRGLRG